VSGKERISSSIYSDFEAKTPLVENQAARAVGHLDSNILPSSFVPFLAIL